MTARERVSATRIALIAGLVGSALLWGAAAAVLLVAIAGVVDWAIGVPSAVRRAALPICLSAGALVSLGVLWRGRRARSLDAVALWIEERLPSLRYALVTALEPRFAAVAPRLELEIAPVRWRSVVVRAVGRALLVPTGTLGLSLVLVATLPRGVVERIRRPHEGDVLERPLGFTAARVNHLTPVVATVTAPAYAGGERTAIENPSTISALAASYVLLEGRGPGDSVQASLGKRGVPVRAGGARWQLTFDMPAHPTALRLRDGRFARLVVLEPRPDSAPNVSLVSPARDTVFRELTDSLKLTAQASDDIGLTAIWFEYIVSSGEGENFTFRSGILNRSAVGGSRSASLSTTLSLSSLKLSPGDVVHLRAVARDGNLATGPGTGASETRTLRVARAGDYDTVAVEGAPPPDVDQSALSERMLIQLAEALERRRPTLARQRVIEESRSISADQVRLRRRVGDVIFSRLGEGGGEEQSGEIAARGKLSPEELLKAAEEATATAGHGVLDFEEGETPVVAINRPLLEAYNAMWDASRELDVGEPGRALPHMRAALAAIQRARQAERIYLRGRSPKVIVDLTKARLAGKIDSAVAAPRSPIPPLDDAAGRRAARFDAALRLLPHAPGAAVDSLLMLRIDALERSPALAAALDRAIDALRAGRDATAALARARRVVAGAPTTRDTVSLWGDAW